MCLWIAYDNPPTRPLHPPIHPPDPPRRSSLAAATVLPRLAAAALPHLGRDGGGENQWLLNASAEPIFPVLKNQTRLLVDNKTRSKLMYLFLFSNVFCFFCVQLKAPIFFLTPFPASSLLLAYSTFYIIGLVLSMQIPFVGFQPIRTSEHMAAAGRLCLWFLCSFFFKRCFSLQSGCPVVSLLVAFEPLHHFLFLRFLPKITYPK